MNKARNNGLVTVDNKVIGIDLGFSYDFISIQSIQSSFGISTKNDIFGYESRKMTKMPNGLHIENYNDSSYIILDPNIGKEYKVIEGKVKTFFNKGLAKDKIDSLLKEYNPNDHDPLSTAWGSYRFVIHGKTSYCGEILSKLEDAFLENDVVIMDSASNLVKHFGLIIYSQIPDNLKKEFYNQDIKNRK